ncbi:hypothetical protein TRFO_40405 [Tritrichomonas foetus]|uniref:Myb-like DNA-binding domain containing protein n=1 Tax=Tritrichomonas foetus TaxID=1144522 RepID=A0A1J4J6P2_9EUKA|nr:hypothetical protein TRFO_40405 [Tritrichomonas foetus]|eukprot:OHS93323.1 hypothetical protein TRFO_40405 [Tritrichomonas foetus]
MSESSDHRNKFTQQDDDMLLALIREKGPKKWKSIARLMVDKSARQCRDRYMNYLRDGISNKPWTEEEDSLLSEKVAKIGTHWSKLTQFFHGRSSNNLKNRWYTFHCRRRPLSPKTKASNSQLNNNSFQNQNNEYNATFSQVNYNKGGGNVSFGNVEGVNGSMISQSSSDVNISSIQQNGVSGITSMKTLLPMASLSMPSISNADPIKSNFHISQNFSSLNQGIQQHFPNLVNQETTPDSRLATTPNLSGNPQHIETSQTINQQPLEASQIKEIPDSNSLNPYAVLPNNFRFSPSQKASQNRKSDTFIEAQHLINEKLLLSPINKPSANNIIYKENKKMKAFRIPSIQELINNQDNI